MLGFMGGIGEVATLTPLDVFVLLLYPHCCGVVSDDTVEHEGFVQELSHSHDMWLWRHYCAGEDDDPEAWKVIRGSGAGKA
jgi:hypothetical protein